MKVMLIGDKPEIREKMKSLIDKEGCETMLASNGHEGIEICDKEKQDLVITDLNLPGMDGIEIMHSVKRLSPETEVILVTGDGEYDTAIQALREGALDYLKKPVDIDQLLLSLGRCREKNKKKKDTPLITSVLVLDDDNVARKKLERIMAKEGYKVMSRGNGKEGLELFKEQKIDIILADLKMPGKNGIEVLKEAKALRSDVEVIMITGHGDEESAIESMREGAINFLKKPIDIEQLLAAVEKAVEKLTLQRSLEYRTRELELTKAVLTRTTSNKEIVLDLTEGMDGPAKAFTSELLDFLPMTFFTADSQGNILFCNKGFSRLFDRTPKEISEDWPEKLQKIGIEGVASDDLKNRIQGLFESDLNRIEVVPLGTYAFMLLTKIKVLTGDGENTLALAVLRGEKKTVKAGEINNG